MVTFINKLLTFVLIPLLMSPLSPVLLIKKLVYLPTETISLTENGISSESDPVYLTAHRGVTAQAPENTIPSYEDAVKLGYYSAECDIVLTKDNVWVLSHGDDINKRFWQLGNISETNFSELRTYRYKNGRNFWKYANMPIPTLDEYLDVFVGTNTRPQIEIKTETYDMLDCVVDSVVKKGLEDSAIIISFDLEQLKVIHELNDKIELWYLVGKITEKDVADAKALGSNTVLSICYEENTAETIKLATDAGVGVSCWTVNSLEDAKALYDMGIRYIETDILSN